MKSGQSLKLVLAVCFFTVWLFITYKIVIFFEPWMWGGWFMTLFGVLIIAWVLFWLITFIIGVFTDGYWHELGKDDVLDD